MLRARIVTGLVLLALILFAIFALDTTWLGVFFGLVLMLGAWEWAALAGLRQAVWRIVYAAGVGAATLTVNFAGNDHLLLVAAGLWWFAVSVRICLGRAPETIPQRPSGGWLLAGLLTLIPAHVGVVALHGIEPNGQWWLLFAFCTVWLADIGAYFAGRRWGRHRLAPAISPGKTWEGLAGGVVLVVLFGLLAGGWLVESLISAVALAVLVAAASLLSVVGDLFESLLKRAAQQKDSGWLLPGHGGVLDRIDSLTAAVPTYALGLAMLPII